MIIKYKMEDHGIGSIYEHLYLKEFDFDSMPTRTLVVDRYRTYSQNKHAFKELINRAKKQGLSVKYTKTSIFKKTDLSITVPEKQYNYLVVIYNHLNPMDEHTINVGDILQF